MKVYLVVINILVYIGKAQTDNSQHCHNVCCMPVVGGKLVYPARPVFARDDLEVSR